MTDLTQPILTEDAYYNAIYNKTRADIVHVMGNISVTADQRSMTELLGPETAEKIANILTNNAITPMINALANLHKTTQSIDLTTHKVLKTDMVLHRIPDIFLFSQQLAALRDNCNVYFDPHALHDKYPVTDGWTTDVMLPENHAVELDREAGIEYVAGEAPLRNINVSVVTTDGALRERVRYCNFTYEDAKTQERHLTDIPAFWDEDAGEFLIVTSIALIRLRDESTIADGVNVSGADIVKAYGNNVVAENDPITRAIFEANHAETKNTKTPD